MAASAVFAASAPDPGTLPAERAHLAGQSLLLDLALAGSRWIAVGERGHVLLSDNKGQSWRQAKSVPTQNLLTAVCFSDEKHGIAVGHDEIVLTTADAGETWARTHYAPEAQQPLLDVACNGRDAIAVGAYSIYFASKDAGATWTEKKFAPGAAALVANPSASARGAEVIAPAHDADSRVSGRGAEATASAPARSPQSPGSRPSGLPQREADSADSSATDADLQEDFHLNRIVAASGSRLYIAAEAGHLYRSDDAGTTWQALPSPYEGSFFGILPLSDDSLLAYGLRGHLFRSDDAGQTWRAIETHTDAMLNDAVRLPKSGVAIVGLSGVVLVSADDGEHFTLAQQNDRKGLSAVLPSGATELITAGDGGLKLIVTGP